MKIELRIDGKKVKINQKANIAVTHSIADVQEPDNTSAGYSKSVEVPLIPYNMRIFRFTNELYSKEQFNNELHTAEYIVDGNTVMSGVAQIDKITYEFGAGRKLVGGSFHVSVIGAAFEWITNAKRQMNELTSDETVKYAMKEVYDNSTQSDVSLVKFFPVDRGAFWKDEDGVKVPRTYLEIKDYHPFFNVWKTLELIFGGYTVQSSMKDLFESLYCSGYIPEQENLDYIKEENDFKAGTLWNETTTHKTNVLLNIFNDLTNEEEGYFQNGVLSPGSGAYPYLRFCPKNLLSVKYDILLNYRAKLNNGQVSAVTALRYADTFLFGTNHVGEQDNFLSEYHFPVEKSDEYSKYSTNSPSEVSGRGNFLIYLDFNQAAIKYQYFKIENRSSIPAEETILSALGLAERWIVTPKWLILSKSLYVFYSSVSEYGPWVNIMEDPNIKITIVWAGDLNLNFNEKLKTDPYTLAPQESHYFACKFKSSNSPNNSFGVSILEGCTISPDIGNYIGTNTPVGISMIGGTNSQLDYIAALRQMFNLMFYTNPLTKEVFIEPRTRFYNLERSEIVDWRGKIDYSQEIEIEELGGDVGNALKLAYASGNEVVEYYNWKNRTELGAYKEALLNKTSDDAKEVVNPMFAPFLLRTVESVGMTIPQEKRENTQDVIDDVDLSLTPIVGYFNEVAERTAGSDKDIYSHYPQLIFQDASKAVNLGFDDIDWMPTEYGLNQYYRDNISAYNVGRRITMHLKLTSQDVEAFQFPNRLMRDFRAVFLLNIDGEDVPCLLESIEDYNPASGASTKCIFISDPNMKLTGDDLTVITYDDVAIGRNNALLGYK